MNFDTDRTDDALKLLRRCNLLFDKMLENNSCLPRAANHSEEQKRLVNPVLKHECVVPVTTCDDQSEPRRLGRWYCEQFLPNVGVEYNFARKTRLIRQRRPVIKNSHLEIQLSGKRCNGLCDMSRACDPQRAWWTDIFK